MSFVEELRKQQIEKARREELLKTQEAAQERNKLQAESEYCEQRRQQAEKFRKESGIYIPVGELIAFLETPTIPVTRHGYGNDGLWQEYTEYKARGGRGLSRFKFIHFKWELQGVFPDPRELEDLVEFGDPHSVRDIISWDSKSSGEYGWIKCSEKYIVVETCPDGTIVFHAGLFGSTTIGLKEWGSGDKGKIFDKALERVYNHPRIDRYSFYKFPPLSCG